MSIGKEQELRLMELLGKLASRDAGDPIPSAMETMLKGADFHGQEHRDAITLTHMGWIRHRHGFTDVTNSWSGEGIYAFNLTEDGRAVLDAWRSSAVDASDADRNNRERRTRPMIMVIHGSKEGLVPPVVDEIRLWCFEQGLEAYKAADLPNSGRFVNDKVNNAMDEADYYVVVLTADEELTTGEFRPRPNAMIEMGRVLSRNPALVCVLKEDKVEMPSDYTGLVTEPLDNWRSVLQRELSEASLL